MAYHITDAQTLTTTPQPSSGLQSQGQGFESHESEKFWMMAYKDQKCQLLCNLR